MTQVGKNNVRIITDSNAYTSYETVIKPATHLRRLLYVNGDGIRETFYNKTLYYASKDNTAGFNIFCGGGKTGIGEDEDHAGTLVLFAAQAKQMNMSSTGLYPVNDNTFRLGNPIQRFSQLYAGTDTINTSDERDKQQIGAYSDDVLDAWGNVEFRRFLFNDAVEIKGNSARIHAGVIAQQVIQAFADKGLDARRYGLLCYDEWEDIYNTIEVVDEPAALDENGDELVPAKTHKETNVVKAGNRYGIRYSEALCLEAAYQRRRANRLEARLAALETAFQNLNAPNTDNEENTNV